MRESYYQARISKYLAERGCKVSKYNASGLTSKGHPDLFVSIPHDPHPIALYIEVKTPTGKLSQAQAWTISTMQAQGHLVTVATTPKDIEDYLKSINICLR